MLALFMGMGRLWATSGSLEGWDTCVLRRLFFSGLPGEKKVTSLVSNEALYSKEGRRRP